MSSRSCSEDSEEEECERGGALNETELFFAKCARLERYFVPLDRKKCMYCRSECFDRVLVNVFIPGTNSKGVKNTWKHPQNNAVIPLCKHFFDKLVNAGKQSELETAEGELVTQYIMVRLAGVMFQKYWLVDNAMINYFRHVKKIRLSMKFSTPPPEV